MRATSSRESRGRFVKRLRSAGACTLAAAGSIMSHSRRVRVCVVVEVVARPCNEGGQWRLVVTGTRTNVARRCTKHRQQAVAGGGGSGGGKVCVERLKTTTAAVAAPEERRGAAAEERRSRCRPLRLRRRCFCCLLSASSPPPHRRTHRTAPLALPHYSATRRVLVVCVRASASVRARSSERVCD